MNADRRLRVAMEQLAAESAVLTPPAELEAALVSEFDRTSRSWRTWRSWQTRLWFGIAAGGVAASLALLSSLHSRSTPHPPIPPPLQIARTAETAPVPEVSHTVTPHRPPRVTARPVATRSVQPFIPIPYVTPLDPYERIDVIRMTLPVAALIAAGLEVQTADPGAQAQADVLVGQDGRARAVRLVSISN